MRRLLGVGSVVLGVAFILGGIYNAMKFASDNVSAERPAIVLKYDKIDSHLGKLRGLDELGDLGERTEGLAEEIESTQASLDELRASPRYKTELSAYQNQNAEAFRGSIPHAWPTLLGVFLMGSSVYLLRK
jgi:hypothetical protein